MSGINLRYDSYAFHHEYGRPNHVFMPENDVTFTEAYRRRSVYIDDNPLNSVCYVECDNIDVEANTADDENPRCIRRRGNPPTILQVPADRQLHLRGSSFMPY